MKVLGLIFCLMVMAIPVWAQEITLRLTGNSIPASFVTQQLQAALDNLYGEDVQIPALAFPPLLKHQTRLVTVPVTFSDDTIKTIKVRVTAESLPKSSDTFLLFSDHPEKVKENGVLFSAGVIFLRPLRLNYYHLNADGEPPRAFTVRLENDNPAPALVRIMDVAVGPMKHEMAAGHEASLLFLKQNQSGLGSIITIPPHGVWDISRQAANGGDLVTGFVDVMELQGSPLQLGVFAEDPAAPWQYRHPLLTSHDTHARGAYEVSNLRFRAAYRVSDPPVIIPLGDLPLPNVLAGTPLKGSYGVLWNGDVMLENPFAEPRRVFFYFQPRGGSASAAFFLEGDLRQVSFVKAYDQVLLAHLDLPPHSRRDIRLESMPEGGSSYPVHLIVKDSQEVKP